MKTALSGQVAVVTGVSRAKGIGAAIARELAKHGAHLFLTGWPGYDDEQPENGAGVQGLLLEKERQSGVGGEWIPLGLTQPVRPRMLSNQCIAIYNARHIMKNNSCSLRRMSLWNIENEKI